MQKKFTFKKGWRFLRIATLFSVLFCLSVSAANAQCTWAAGVPLPTGYLDMPVVTVGSNLYTFSGVSNGALPTTSNKFDGTAWTTIAPLPAAKEYASATTDGTNVFIIGGVDGGGIYTTTNYLYNIATNTYTTKAPCTVASWNHAAVFLNGKIYKIGGTIGTGLYTNKVEIYDVAANTWSAGANYPSNISFVSAIALNGYIYVAGGYDGVDLSAKTYRYDPVANTWDDASIADLPVKRAASAYSYYRNQFMVAGGWVNTLDGPGTSTNVIGWNPTTKYVGCSAEFT